MSAMKIAEPACLRTRLNRTGDDSFKVISRLNFQCTQHCLRGLADGNHQHAVVSMKIVKVFADTQHPAFAGNMTLESSINAGFTQRTFEKLPRRDPHLNGDSLAVGR